MTPITTDRLVIRDWQESDRPLFHEINSDEEVMAYFPFRRDRAEADAMMDRLRQGIAERGFGFSALALRETGEPIGMAGLAPVDFVPELPENSIEIGWRLARPHWGQGLASEAARALLNFGFSDLLLPRIVSFTVRENRRSRAVMERIGMRRARAYDFAHPRVPDEHAALKPHVVYVIERGDWETMRRA